MPQLCQPKLTVDQEINVSIERRGESEMIS